MSVLFDIAHPAHVHFFRHLHSDLRNSGIPVSVLARDKDVTHDLLEGFGIDYETHGRSGVTSRVGQFSELAARVRRLRRMIKDTDAEIVLTRNPAGVIAARLTGRIGVFDTDDGRAAGAHFRVAAPFAHTITTPTSIGETYGAKHRKYAGYKALAYLHPNNFRPDSTVLDHLGVEAETDFSIVRFVDMVAAHDHNEHGLQAADKAAIVDDLALRGPVFVSSEGELPAAVNARALAIPPHMMHDALAFAACYVGDSQTMAAEAALLGTPSFQISTWSRRLSYLAELQDSYGLIESFTPDRAHDARRAIRAAFDETGARSQLRSRGLDRLYQDKIDVADWYRNLTLELLTARRS